MAQSALRRGRHSAPGNLYFVTTATANRVPLFADFTCGRLVVQSLRALHEAGIAGSVAWIVMPDHVHWLLQVRDHPLAEIMRCFKGRSARDVNRQLGRTGQVWQPAYHDHALRHGESVNAMIRDMLENPVRGGFVAHYTDYPLWDVPGMFDSTDTMFEAFHID